MQSKYKCLGEIGDLEDSVSVFLMQQSWWRLNDFVFEKVRRIIGSVVAIAKGFLLDRRSTHFVFIVKNLLVMQRSFVRMKEWGAKVENVYLLKSSQALKN